MDNPTVFFKIKNFCTLGHLKPVFMAKIGQNGPYGPKIGKIKFSPKNRKSDPRAPPKNLDKIIRSKFWEKNFFSFAVAQPFPIYAGQLKKSGFPGSILKRWTTLRFFPK